jgi:high-affinity iron transporter
LKQHTDKVVESGTLFATAALAFLAVFREGAETALFLHTVAKSNGGWGGGVITGILAASLGLAAIFYVINTTTRRLPLRPVFLITSGFLFLMGLKFVGEAIQEFQEQAMVGLHPAPVSDTLMLLGLNPSWEALGTQLTILLLAAASVVIMTRQQRRVHTH